MKDNNLFLDMQIHSALYETIKYYSFLLQWYASNGSNTWKQQYKSRVLLRILVRPIIHSEFHGW